jgi:hypothetical protein
LKRTNYLQAILLTIAALLLLVVGCSKDQGMSPMMSSNTANQETSGVGFFQGMGVLGDFGCVVATQNPALSRFTVEDFAWVHSQFKTEVQRQCHDTLEFQSKAVTILVACYEQRACEVNLPKWKWTPENIPTQVVFPSFSGLNSFIRQVNVADFFTEAEQRGTISHELAETYRTISPLIQDVTNNDYGNRCVAVNGIMAILQDKVVWANQDGTPQDRWSLGVSLDTFGKLQKVIVENALGPDGSCYQAELDKSLCDLIGEGIWPGWFWGPLFTVLEWIWNNWF